MAKYIQIPAWAHFWNVDGQLRLYFLQITGYPGSSYHRYKHLTLLLLAYSFIHFFGLTQLPLTPFQRHLLSDQCLFFGQSPTLNWIYLLFGGDNFAFHLRMYQPATQVLRLIGDILFGQIGRQGGGKNQVMVVRKYVAKYLLLMQYFVFFQSKS